MSQQTVDAPPARPSRRSVAAGMAWAVPVIAVGAAAPRAAASPCNPQAYTLDWGGSNTSYTRNNAGTSGVATIDPDGAGPVASVSMSIASQFIGTMKAGNEFGNTNNNIRVSSSSVGGTGQVGLSFHQALTNAYNVVPGRSARQEVTFSFDAPVTGLTFMVTDIDSNAGDFNDRIEFSGAFTSQIANTNTLTGAGTQPNPFAPTNANAPVNDTSSTAGNVRITYPGTITSFTMTYWNAVSSYSGVDRSQGVFLSDFAFSVIRNNC
ncbi:hypothetical protein [Phycicoccus avicenniae]|uniref:hypothetical protein n=1 Tax=Phycicoccus avicenniae TaxID=2828860 RepID=UPI003D2A99F8